MRVQITCYHDDVSGITDPIDYDDIDDLGDEDAWQEEEMEQAPARCLFCEELIESSDAVLQHCSNSHQFNIREICRRWKLDCFGYIKMVNFIRSQVRTIMGIS